jgi:hypothetical protein
MSFAYPAHAEWFTVKTQYLNADGIPKSLARARDKLRSHALYVADLEKENSRLWEELREANITIQSLRREVDRLYNEGKTKWGWLIRLCREQDGARFPLPPGEGGPTDFCNRARGALYKNRTTRRSRWSVRVIDREVVVAKIGEF